MRPFELLLVVVTAAAAILYGLSSRLHRPRWSRYISPFIWLILAIHLAVEGWRLQMFPLYLAIVLLAALTYGDIQGGRRWILVAGLMVCVTVGGLAAYLFPVFTLPQPKGPYGVGTVVHYLVDKGRHERHASEPDAPRELMIQVWYPAKHLPGTRAWYRDPRMNTWRSQHLRLVKTHSYWNLPVADQPSVFPVILFSPSSGGYRNQNTFEVEELASQGYVVVGIDHPYSGSRVVFPDGRMAHSVPWMDLSSRAALNASTRRVELMVADHAADATFILDEMERWNALGSGHLLAGRLNLNKVGAIGHSFGGAFAAAATASDRRIVAGINMDGWMFGPVEKNGIPKPFFFMNSEEGLEAWTRPSDPSDLEAERDREHGQTIQKSLEQYGGYTLLVLGAHHGNYSDLVLLQRPLPFLAPREVDPYRVFQIVNAFTLAFFDRYLRDQSEKLLDEGGFSGEVRYRFYPAPLAADKR